MALFARLPDRGESINGLLFNAIVVSIPRSLRLLDFGGNVTFFPDSTVLHLACFGQVHLTWESARDDMMENWSAWGLRVSWDEDINRPTVFFELGSDGDWDSTMASWSWRRQIREGHGVSETYYPFGQPAHEPPVTVAAWRGRVTLPEGWYFGQFELRRHHRGWLRAPTWSVSVDWERPIPMPHRGDESDFISGMSLHVGMQWRQPEPEEALAAVEKDLATSRVEECDLMWRPPGEEQR